MAQKSATYWVTWEKEHIKNSTSLDELTEPFKSNAKAFVKVLKDAGAKVDVSTTKRKDKRDRY